MLAMYSQARPRGRACAIAGEQAKMLTVNEIGWHLGANGRKVRDADAVPKYDPLFEFLCRAGDAPVEMTFDDVGALVGGLPRSAGDHLVWWSNEALGGRHVQSVAWMNAGRQVDNVDLARRIVRFSASRWNRGS